MLQINHLYKSYGKFLALNDLNLHIDKGEIFGFVGPNGAGKTTTMRIICGLLKASGGQVFVNGVDAIQRPGDIKRMVGYVPDFFGVYDNLKVSEYMEFYGSMYGLSKKDTDKIADGLLELVNLSDKKDFFVDTLSRGMKQRLCVARALIHNPELLVLDEPNSGLDPRARFEMKEVLKNLGSMGKTIIISSHILPELSELCTSIGVMEHGRLIASGHVDEIMARSRHVRPITIRAFVPGIEEKNVYVPSQEEIKQNMYVQDQEEVKQNMYASSQEAARQNMYVSDTLGDQNMSVPGQMDSEAEKNYIMTLLRQEPLVTGVKHTEEEYQVNFAGDDREAAMLLKHLLDQGVMVSHFHREKEDLESLFLEITGGVEDAQ